MRSDLKGKRPVPVKQRKHNCVSLLSRMCGQQKGFGGVLLTALPKYCQSFQHSNIGTRSVRAARTQNSGVSRSMDEGPLHEYTSEAQSRVVGEANSILEFTTRNDLASKIYLG